MQEFNKLPREARDIIELTIALEEGYVDNPYDSGGRTRWGVTAKEARAAGYTGDMRDLPKEFAYELIAVRRFWKPGKLDKVLQISPTLASEVFDNAYNMGVSQSWKLVQRALNVMNRHGNDWPDIGVDGKPGPATFSALEAAVKRRGEKHVYNVLNVCQAAFYLELAERREKDEEFFNGWVAHRVKLL